MIIELPPPPFCESVKNWNENIEIENEIEVKDILRQPPPLIMILKIFESPPLFFACEDLLNESGLQLSKTMLRACQRTGMEY